MLPSVSANERLYERVYFTIRDMLRDPVCAVSTQGTNTIVGESILFNTGVT